MSPLVFLNIIFSPLMILILIYVDYQKKEATDSAQKKIFLLLLSFTALSMIADLATSVFTGKPGGGIHILLTSTKTIYYATQIAAYYFVFLFIDYYAYTNLQRTKTLTKGAVIVLVINLILLVVSFDKDFYFFFDQDNQFVRGKFYPVRLAISYIPAALAFIDILLSKANNDHSTLNLTIFFLLLTSLGAIVDLLAPETVKFIWPCFCVSLLFAYFFIIRNDSLTDPLTGIGNRHSFNEFIKSLSTSKESYSVALIDIDDFKAINDTHGHLAGDEALTYFARVLKHSVRSTDYLARYGGDEFIIATKSQEDIETIVKRIQTTLREDNRRSGQLYKLKISYGYDAYPSEKHASFEDFLKHIDNLMYENKNRNKKKN